MKHGLESRCEQKCKNSRNPILKFSLLTVHAKLTRNRKRKWSRNSIDYETSDAVKPEQPRDQIQKTHLESPRSTTQTESEQTATQHIQTVRCHNNVEHNFGQDCTKLFTDFSNFAPDFDGRFSISSMKCFLFVRACGMMTNSEVLAASFESGTWIIYDSKLLNLESLEVVNVTSNAIQILGNLCPRQSVDPDASMERNTRKDQNKEVVAQLVSTIDTDHVKSKNQDKEGTPDYQNPLILLNFNGAKTSMNAQNAQVE